MLCHVAESHLSEVRQANTSRFDENEIFSVKRDLFELETSLDLYRDLIVVIPWCLLTGELERYASWYIY